ncbi:MAG: hypothetical protein M3257_01305, partial [Actinomycetota bacterium]|nr:hypothetical protein [Actinomycetota bacterium]
VQRMAGTDPVTATSRRLGLGPPLTPHALTAQRSLARPSSPATPSTPAVHSDAEGPGPGEPPPSAGEPIAPLIGQSGSVPVQDDAPASDATAVDAVSTLPMAQTVREASPPQVEPPLPVIPVLRAPDSSMSPSTEAPVPPADASAPPADLPSGAVTDLALPVPVVSAVPTRPVVARLVGDRTPPLLAAPSPAAELADPGGRAEQPPSGAAVDVQRTAAEPLLTGGPPAPGCAAGSIEPPTVTGARNAVAGAVGDAALRPASHLHGGPAPVPIQLMPVVSHPAPVPAQRMPSVGHSAPVVQRQAALLETTPPQTVPTPPEAVAAGAPVPDVPPEGGADVVSESGGPDAAESAPGASPAGSQVAGAPAGPGAPAAAGSPDELVKKLFDPLLRRLKNELRLDRERRGVLTDLRH